VCACVCVRVCLCVCVCVCVCVCAHSDLSRTQVQDGHSRVRQMSQEETDKELAYAVIVFGNAAVGVATHYPLSQCAVTAAVPVRGRRGCGKTVQPGSLSPPFHPPFTPFSPLLSPLSHISSHLSPPLPSRLSSHLPLTPLSPLFIPPLTTLSPPSSQEDLDFEAAQRVQREVPKTSTYGREGGKRGEGRGGGGEALTWGVGGGGRMHVLEIERGSLSESRSTESNKQKTADNRRTDRGRVRGILALMLSHVVLLAHRKIYPTHLFPHMILPFPLT
jgi:hypothetical protein